MRKDITFLDRFLQLLKMNVNDIFKKDKKSVIIIGINVLLILMKNIQNFIYIYNRFSTRLLQKANKMTIIKLILLKMELSQHY